MTPGAAQSDVAAAAPAAREGDAPAGGLLALAIGTSILAVSTAAVLVRLSAAGPMSVAFHRLAIATALLGAFGLAARRASFATLTRRDAPAILGAGLLLALHFAAWIASLGLTTIAASLFLVTTHPVLVALASHVRGERLAAVGWAGLAVALAGGALIAWTDAAEGAHSLAGDALALLGSVAIAGYFLLARSVRQRVDLVPYATATYGVAAGALLLAVVAAGEPLVGYAATDYAIFAALAVVPMIFGHTVLNWAIRWVKAPVVSATILGEPVAGSALAFLVLGEVPAGTILAGGALVLLGISLVVRGR